MTPSLKEPMLACSKAIDLETYKKFPMYASYKEDGIRCLVFSQGGALSRTLKPIPNRAIRQVLTNLHKLAVISPDLVFDGELVTQNLVGVDDPYNTVQSKVMTTDYPETFNWTYKIFDVLPIGYLKTPYDSRYKMLQTLNELVRLSDINCQIVEQVLVKSRPELETMVDLAAKAGKEGLILRSPLSPYKQGRSTAGENYLMKVKSFQDSEAIILGMTEMMTNTNMSTTSSTGKTERSSHLNGQIGSGVMGSLKVKDYHSGVEFEIGTGFTQSERIVFWNNRQDFIIKRTVIKYKSQQHGVKDKPRSPVYQGFRTEEDL